jgi:DNA repair protein RecO (recombination protein O)
MTEAFILDTRSSRERDKIVTFFTEDEGKLSGVAHGAARSVKRFGGRLERLTRVRLRFFEKEGRDLVRVEDLELLQEAFQLQHGLKNAAALSYICEITTEFTREKESDSRYYRLLVATLDGFRAGADVDILVRYFEYWTARLNGVFPSLDSCDGCGKIFGQSGAGFAVDGGAALCGRCRKPEHGRMVKISGAGLTMIGGFQRHSPSALLKVVYPKHAIREVEAAATAVLRSFTGREFKSKSFLNQVLRIAESRS